eukprot:14487300-Ditylum_brightwellii.AAC.1
MGHFIGDSAMYLKSCGNTFPVSFTAFTGANYSVVSFTDGCSIFCCKCCLFPLAQWNTGNERLRIILPYLPLCGITTAATPPRCAPHRNLPPLGTGHLHESVSWHLVSWH